MILLSLDFESTGLDVINDHVIEMGAVLYSTQQHKCLDSQGVLVKTDKIITPEITAITSVHPAAVERFGYEQDSVLDILISMMEAADHIIGYNDRRFDKKVAESCAGRNNVKLPEKIWLDLFQDLPYNVPTGKLSHVAADHGILNLFPHSAMSDAQTVLAIASKYDPELLLQRAQSPVVVLVAHAERSQNDLVKRAKFRWNPSRKIWWKSIKEQDIDEAISTIQFNVSIEKGLSPEELDN